MNPAINNWLLQSATLFSHSTTMTAVWMAYTAPEGQLVDVKNIKEHLWSLGLWSLVLGGLLGTT